MTGTSGAPRKRTRSTLGPDAPPARSRAGLLADRDFVEVRLGGSGGQGVVLMGIILATAANHDGRCVVQTESYDHLRKIRFVQLHRLCQQQVHGKLHLHKCMNAETLKCQVVRIRLKYQPK